MTVTLTVKKGICPCAGVPEGIRQGLWFHVILGIKDLEVI